MLEVEYFVYSAGFTDGPFDKEEAVRFLYRLCNDLYAPPERITSTVIFSKTGDYQDVVKFHGTTLDGKYVYWHPTQMNEILEQLSAVV